MPGQALLGQSRAVGTHARTHTAQGGGGHLPLMIRGAGWGSAGPWARDGVRGPRGGGAGDDAAAPDDEERRSSVSHGGSSPEKKKRGYGNDKRARIHKKDGQTV